MLHFENVRALSYQQEYILFNKDRQLTHGYKGNVIRQLYTHTVTTEYKPIQITNTIKIHEPYE